MYTITLNLPTTPGWRLIKAQPCVTITDIRSVKQNPNLPLNTGCIIFRVLIDNDVNQKEITRMKVDKLYILSNLNLFKKDILPLRICEDIVAVDIIRSNEDICKGKDVNNILVEVDYN